MKQYRVYSICLFILMLLSACESVSDVGLLRSIEVANEIEKSNLPKEEGTFVGIVKAGDYYYTARGKLFYRKTDQKFWSTLALTDGDSAKWNVSSIYKAPAPSELVYVSLIHKENKTSKIVSVSDPTDASKNKELNLADHEGQLTLILGLDSNILYVFSARPKLVLPSQEQEEDSRYQIYSIDTSITTSPIPFILIGNTNIVKKVVISNNLFFMISDSALYILNPASSTDPTDKLQQVKRLVDDQDNTIQYTGLNDIAVTASGDILLTPNTYNNENNSVLIKINSTDIASFDFSNDDSLTAKVYDAETHGAGVLGYYAVHPFPYMSENYVLIGHKSNQSTFASVYAEDELGNQTAIARLPVSLRGNTILRIEYFSDTKEFFAITSRAGLWRFRISDFNPQLNQDSIVFDMFQE